MKKTTLGLILNVIAVALAVIGVVAYLINTGTSYFSNQGVNGVVVATACIAAVVLAAYVVLTMKGPKMWADLFPVCAGALLVVATITLIGARVAGIASILTFEGNAQTMADMTSALVAIVALLAAAIMTVVASFHDVAAE